MNPCATTLAIYAATQKGGHVSEHSPLQLMEKWGYDLLPPSHPGSPGHTGLLVAIREKPTRQHFDPETISLQIRDENGRAKRAKLRLEIPEDLAEAGPRHVCPGQVVLRDRADRRVDFFVFGGRLEATSAPDETVYSLHSPAPILKVKEDLESLQDQLAFETEALLARVEAKWGSDDEGFAHWLGQVDSLRFYLATVHWLLKHFEENRARREAAPELYQALRNEKIWLTSEGQWTATPSELESLLAPS